jgi:two-component system chemotaxis sensor kinase CheA
MDRRQLEEFLEDAGERLEEIRRDAEALRFALADGPARRELLGRVLRAVHTLKGSGAAQGVTQVSHVAHEFESLLDALGRGRVALDDAALDLFDATADALSEQLRAASRGEQAQAPPLLIERLRRSARVEEPAILEEPWQMAEAALPFEVARTLGGAERARLREATAEGAHLFVVEAEFDAADFDERFRRLSAALAAGGEIISTQPAAKGGNPSRVVFRIVYATHAAAGKLAARVAEFGATLTAASEQPDVAASTTQTPTHADPHADGDAFQPPYPLSVRVPLDELDELIARAHELFREAVGALEARGDGATHGASAVEADAEAARVRRRFYEFQERLIGLRMVALLPTLERAARAGRAAARAAGCEVEFELSGGDVRVDKSLVEALADPLLHLARNAAFHGLESPAERAAAGKPTRGRVRIEAVAEGPRVTLRVTDDGRGIDPAVVARAAARRGLIAQGATVDEGQALRLIFAPGFSTSEEVTGASGRGIGLDVVERAVERAGGEVRVRSLRGFGSTFELRLPACIALVPSLVVRAGEDLYCLDSRRVVATAVAGPDQLARAVAGDATVNAPEHTTPEPATNATEHVTDEASEQERVGETLIWRGRRLPLVHLRALLGASDEAGLINATDAAPVPFVVMRSGAVRGAQVAIAVDELRGSEEVLARGLGRHASRWRGVSGATELRDGTIALLLDATRLLEQRY